jgi:hypothetical protein
MYDGQKSVNRCFLKGFHLIGRTTTAASSLRPSDTSLLHPDMLIALQDGEGREEPCG